MWYGVVSRYVSNAKAEIRLGIFIHFILNIFILTVMVIYFILYEPLVPMLWYSPFKMGKNMLTEREIRKCNLECFWEIRQFHLEYCQ